jgi:hypothetical protein
MIPSHKRSETPERPITFRAAEDLGAFQLAEQWADRTAWPISERTAYDELAELATMSALAKWHEWAATQRDFVFNGKPGITGDEYEKVALRFAALGIKQAVP